jgi:uroporphyrinogen-III synthase
MSRRTLYLGLDPSNYRSSGPLVHYPVIGVALRPIDRSAFDQMALFTHLIFTSKVAVRFFFEVLEQLEIERLCLEDKTFIAVGKATAFELKKEGCVARTAEDERQEGVIALLAECAFSPDSYLFLPRSARARPFIDRFLEEKGIRFCAYDLYDTFFQAAVPIPDLREVDDIVFTSPSTVEAFHAIFPVMPKEKRVIARGPITQAAIVKLYGKEIECFFIV